MRVDLINLVMNAPALVSRALNAVLVRTQNGRVRSYAMVMVFGATAILLTLAMALLLFTHRLSQRRLGEEAES